MTGRREHSQNRGNKENRPGRAAFFPVIALLLDLIYAYYWWLHFSVEATVNTDHLIGFNRSTIENRVWN